jgi:hypothetical protein
MNDFKDQFKMLRDDLALSAEERAGIRDVLASLPLDAETPSVASPSPYVTFLPWQRSVLAFAVLLAVMVGGTTFAAEGALPGDTLYGVKLGLNERVERMTAIGTLAKAEVDVRHAEERIREVELLAAQGEEDTRDVREIADTVDAHIRLASDAAETLFDEGNPGDADLLATRIDSALSAHADILEAQAENEDEAGKRKLRALSVALSLAAKERVPEDDSTRGRGNDYYAKILAAREGEAKKRVETLTGALKSNGVPEESVAALEAERAAVEAEFEAARMRAAEGDTRDAAEEYGELGKRAYRAYALFTSAKRIADKTDKEVVVSLGGEADASTTEPPSEAEMMLMAEMAAPAEDSEMNAKRAVEEEEVPELRFLIRDRN